MKHYRTQTEFHKVLKVSKSTMSRYVHRPDWPVKRRPPWNRADLKAVQRWREGLQENRADDPVYDPELIEWLKREAPELLDDDFTRALIDHVLHDGPYPDADEYRRRIMGRRG